MIGEFDVLLNIRMPSATLDQIDELKKVRSLKGQKGANRSAIIRDAVDEYLLSHAKDMKALSKAKKVMEK